MNKYTKFTALAMLLLSNTVLANDLPKHELQPVKLTAAEEKVQACGACHGGDVSMNPLWPNLAGQRKPYLIKQLKDFRAGKRKDPVMGPMAKPLTDKDIEEMATYYSNLKPQVAVVAAPTPAPAPAPAPAAALEPATKQY